MRQRLGLKKIAKLHEMTGLNIDHVLVRGNTQHRLDLHIVGTGYTVDEWVSLYSDGSTDIDGFTWDADTWFKRRNRNHADHGKSARSMTLQETKNILVNILESIEVSETKLEIIP